MRPFHPAYAQSRTRATADKVNAFEKVRDDLYRYTPIGTYHARIQINYKEVRRSLGTMPLGNSIFHLG